MSNDTHPDPFTSIRLTLASLDDLLAWYREEGNLSEVDVWAANYRRDVGRLLAEVDRLKGERGETWRCGLQNALLDATQSWETDERDERTYRDMVEGVIDTFRLGE